MYIENVNSRARQQRGSYIAPISWLVPAVSDPTRRHLGLTLPGLLVVPSPQASNCYI